MRVVVKVPDEPGVLELNFMWLPTWIGMNVRLQAQLKEKLGKEFVGMEINDDSLDAMSKVVVDTLVELHPHITGLREYLEALKCIDDGQEQQQDRPAVPSDQA
jgi:hypothetical protein